MSLNLALSSAVSSILTIQQQMSIASNNLANANTEGYSKQTLDVQARVTGGVGTGVDGVGIITYVNKYLLNSVVKAGSQAGETGAINDYYFKLQQALGTIISNETGGSDFASLFSTLENRLSALAASPEQAALKTEVVNALNDITRSMNSYTNKIQSLRTEANHEIAATINDSNAFLHKIADLNKKIGEAEARGEPTASFEDQRMAALKSLGENISISYYTDSRNQVNISISGGYDLLFGTTVREFQYTPVNVMDATDTTVPPIMLGGDDITAKVAAGSGKLAGLCAVIGDDFVRVQDEIDNLIFGFASVINGAYGAQTSLTEASPTTSPYVGPVIFTGTDRNGNAISHSISPTWPLPIPAIPGPPAIPAVLATVKQVMDAINAPVSLGPPLVPSPVTASLQGGQLVIKDSLTGANLSTTDAAFEADFQTTAAVAAGNLLTIDGSGRISVDTLISANPSTLRTGVSGASGDSSLVSGMVDALLQRQPFGAAGNLGNTRMSLASYAATIIADITSNASAAQDQFSTKGTTWMTLKSTLSGQAGVNADEESASLVMLQNAFASSSKIISTVREMFNSLLQAVG